MAGIRGGGGVQTNVSLAKKSEVNDSVNSVTSIRLHKRWGVNTLQYSHPLTRTVTHLALSCNALYTWLTYISNYHNNRTLIIGEKKHKNPIREQIFSFSPFTDVMTHTGFLENTRMFVTHEPKVNDLQTSRVKINVKQFSILYGLMIQIHLLLKRIMATISETWIFQGWIQNVKF